MNQMRAKVEQSHLQSAMGTVLDALFPRPGETKEQFFQRRISFIEHQLATMPRQPKDWRQEREATLAKLRDELAALQAKAASNGHVQPMNLAEAIDHEASSYRSQGTDVAIFLAGQLERLAQLVRFTGASTPQEHLDRMEVWDAEIAEQHFERGYAEGYEAGLRQARRHLA